MDFSPLHLKIAAERAVQGLQVNMARLQDFAHSYQEVEGQKGDAVAVPVITLSAAAEFNADSNNYCGGENEVDGKLVTLSSHYVKSVSITDRELAASDMNWIGDVAEAEIKVLGKAAEKQVFGLISQGTLSAEVGSLSSIQEIAALAQEAYENDIEPGYAVLVLNPELFYKACALLPANTYGATDAIQAGRIPGVFGFKSVICTNDLPSGVVGAIVQQDAIGIASRYLAPMDGAYPFTDKAILPNTFVVGFRGFQNLCSGKRYLAGEILWGANALVPGKIIKLSAAD